jgi:hypothetical protein
MLGFVTVKPATAQQAPSPPQQNSGAGVGGENNGEDFTRPLNLFQIRGEYRSAPGNGSDPGTLRTVRTEQVILRSDLKFDIFPQWTFALRGRSAICRQGPDHQQQSEWRFRRRLRRCRPSSSPHQDVQRALGRRRRHPHCRSHRRS